MNTQVLIEENRMILIGSTGRNSGKTTLTTNIIEKYKNKIPIFAFKLITVRDHSDICPRGGQGCGICKGLKGGYDITEEVKDGTKDTMLLKKAGAKKVYLIRALKDNLLEALEDALHMLPNNCMILCESNSARLVMKPACFVMINNTNSTSMKPSAEAVIHYADMIINQDKDVFDDFVENKIKKFISRIE